VSSARRRRVITSAPASASRRASRPPTSPAPATSTGPSKLHWLMATPGAIHTRSRCARMLASAPMNPAPNLVLVGPMGAGKTSIGRQLAKRLGLAFVDCDHLLEQRTGAAVPVIFECEGETGFRQRESALIAELMLGHDQ